MFHIKWILISIYLVEFVVLVSTRLSHIPRSPEGSAWYATLFAIAVVPWWFFDAPIAADVAFVVSSAVLAIAIRLLGKLPPRDSAKK